MYYIQRLRHHFENERAGDTFASGVSEKHFWPPPCLKFTSVGPFTSACPIQIHGAFRFRVALLQRSIVSLVRLVSYQRVMTNKVARILGVKFAPSIKQFCPWGLQISNWQWLYYVILRKCKCKCQFIRCSKSTDIIAVLSKEQSKGSLDEGAGRSLHAFQSIWSIMCTKCILSISITNEAFMLVFSILVNLAL